MNLRKIFGEFEVCKKIYANDFLSFYEKIQKDENFKSKDTINSHTIDSTDLINLIIDDINSMTQTVDPNTPGSAMSVKNILSNKNINRGPNIHTKVCSLCFGILVAHQNSNISQVCSNVYNSLIVNKE